MKNLLAERLYLLRSERNLTQRQVGDAIDVSNQTINDMEKGRSATTLERATLLAKFFNVSLDYLIGLSDDPGQPYQGKPAAIPKDEKALLTSYRKLSSPDRKKLLDYAELLLVAHQKINVIEVR